MLTFEDEFAFLPEREFHGWGGSGYPMWPPQDGGDCLSEFFHALGVGCAYVEGAADEFVVHGKGDGAYDVGDVDPGEPLVA